MEELASTQHDHRPIEDIHNKVWLILIGALLLLCSTTILITVSIYFFFFLSSTPMDLAIQVSQGTAGLVASDFSEQVVRAGLTNVRDRPTSISTDEQSQATVTFRMMADDGQQRVLMIITLENSSSLTIERADRPRFAWSRGMYRVELTNVSGEIDIYSAQEADRRFILLVESQSDTATVRIDQAGRYSYEANDDQLRLVTREGVASFLMANRTNSRLVSRGEEAILIHNRPPYVATSATNLLENSLFDLEV